MACSLPSIHPEFLKNSAKNNHRAGYDEILYPVIPFTLQLSVRAW